MNRDLFGVAGEVVAITGGAGKLGLQFAQAFAERGAKVAVLDLPSALKGLSADDVRLVGEAVDVTRKQDLEAALARIRARWSVPTVLVNCAAIDSPPDAPIQENGPFETYPEASWDRVMTVNTKGVFLASQVFGGAMAEAGKGSIINISSIYGMVSPDQSIYEYRRQRGEAFYKPVAYAASKSALMNLTRYLATYWARRGVRVNTLTFAGVFADQDREFLDAYCARIPVGRMARAEEYVGPLLFLSSPASSYMTGANLVVDGAWTAI
jgi:NAD(P)-dependent dehydrogenase (short-subunit alcohol dehydrogenase family)